MVAELTRTQRPHNHQLLLSPADKEVAILRPFAEGVAWHNANSAMACKPETSLQAIEMERAGAKYLES